MLPVLCLRSEYPTSSGCVAASVEVSGAKMAMLYFALISTARTGLRNIPNSFLNQCAFGPKAFVVGSFFYFERTEHSSVIEHQ